MGSRIDALVLVLAGMITVLAINEATGTSDDLEIQAKTYCEMVHLYEFSQGQVGWPDYKQTAERDCK